MDRTRKIASKPIEEEKEADNRNTSFASKQKFDDSRSYKDIDVQLYEINQRSELNSTNDQFALQKLKTSLKNRKKYQANCIHK